MTQRIGFCCKYLGNVNQVNGFKPKDLEKSLNTSITTVKWLNENKTKVDEKLWSLIKHNLNSTYQLVSKVGSFPASLRMMRISSDLLPVYTEPTYRSFYNSATVRHYIEKEFAKIGELARSKDIRLSYHPGQFCVLASESEDVVNRSIEEFEYHVDMARYMGYGSDWHDHGFKINVHIAGAQGAEGIIRVLPRLSKEAQNLITIENEEMKWGLEETLKLEKHLAIVLDIHHHWVKTGEYIQVNDDRVKRIVDSWRGVRPAMHYSMPRSEFVATHLNNEGLPDYQAALSAGIKKASLRAHSDFYWCQAANDWAATFMPQFDIQAEAKAKNLASKSLAQSVGLI
jgi:UV DNA damage endonuclease